MQRISLWTLSAAWLLFSPGSAAQPAWEPLVSSLDLEQQVGQLFLVSFRGPRVDAQARRLIETVRPGGVLLYRTNTDSAEQVARLTGQLQGLSLSGPGGLGLFVAIDMEGGLVNRQFGEGGFSACPPAMLVAAAGREDRAEALGRSVAGQLAAVGINLNLAPVADLARPDGHSGLRQRTFGSDPGLVGRLVAASVRGTQQAGVIAVVKHFPGLGAAQVDSHQQLPRIDLDRASLERADLVPFRQAVQARVGGVMLAHAWYPALDPRKRMPASLSRPVIEDLLRTGLGYQGLIVTDALDMGALDRDLGLAGAAVAAIAAGADLVTFGSSVPVEEQIATVAEVVRAVRSGELDRARVLAALRRLLAIKSRHGVLRPGPADPHRAIDALDDAGHRDLVRTLAAEAVTLVRDEQALLPLRPERPTLLLAPEHLGEFARACQRESPALRVVLVTEAPDEEACRSTSEAAWAAETVVLVIDRPGRATLAPGLIAALPVGRLVVAALGPPDLLEAVSQAPAWVAAYWDQPASQAALCDVLLGKRPPGGVLPIPLGSRHPAGSGLRAFAPRPTLP